MAQRNWAGKVIETYQCGPCRGKVHVEEVAKLLTNEHARAVRIVKRAKRLELHGLRDTDTNEFLEGYEAACVDILSALKKGRA